MFITVFIMTILTRGLVRAQRRDIDTCVTGYYMSSPSSETRPRCQPCSRCQPGFRVQFPCSITTDTVCSQCSPGTYSSSMTTNMMCTPCRRCKSNQLSENCSAEKDTVCRNRCRSGFYFEQTSRTCKRCSYCPRGSTERVYECTQQGGNEMNQCAEGAATRARQLSHHQPRDRFPMPPEFHGYAYRQDSDNQIPDAPSDDYEVIMPSPDTSPSSIRSYRSTTMSSTRQLLRTIDASAIHQPFQPEGLRGQMVKGYVSRLENRHMSTSSSLYSTQTSEFTHGDVNSYQEEATLRSKPGPISGRDILMICGIMLTCGLMSFVTTAITCHFLMKHGVVKNGSSTVAAARGRPTVKGWIALPLHETLRSEDPTYRVQSNV